jgi:hypothetical protein
MTPLKVLHDITTARDNESPSLLRIAALGWTLVFIAWSVVAMVRGQEFDPRAYGEGAGLLALAIGTALRISLPTNSGNDGWRNSAMPPQDLMP